MASIAVIRGSEAPDPESSTDTLLNLNVGTRKSELALAQTRLVVDALKETSPGHVFTVRARDTAAGDIDKVTAFKDMAVKNIWTHELETLMIEGKLDLLVHSLKDVPTQLPKTCEIGAVLERADSRDVLVVKAGRPACKISELPAGSRIGTSSIRRTAQLACRFPHFKVVDIRGNIGTRLAKLDAAEGPYDAIIIAAAGLLRLDLGHRISQYLDYKDSKMMYAVGQGAIGIENRSDDSIVRSLLSRINHVPTFLPITAERSLLRTLEGGCSAPLGVETEWVGAAEPSSMLMRAIVVSVDGQEHVEVEIIQKVDSVESAEAFGVDVAQKLLDKGAGKILDEIQAKKRTTAADLQET